VASRRAEEPGVVAASVTIETAPDTGSRLAATLRATSTPVAQAMLREVVDT
jgi:hypothetical protein